MGRLTAIVLGAAAGGGYPQWNCRCPICRLAWEGDGRVKLCTQASVAVSADGDRWVLLNASPDLRSQLNATRALHPRDGLRHSPIDAVVLTGAEIDQIAGLLNLRERQAFALYGTAESLAPGQPWADIRAVGNVLRHEYDNVDPAVIWQIVAHDLRSLRQAVEAALRRLRNET